MTVTQTDAAIANLIAGMRTRVYPCEHTKPRPSTARLDRARADAYIEAAHAALTALGCTDVPPAPFGLGLIVADYVRAAGPRPPATAPAALARWRTDLDAAIAQAIGASS